MFQYIVRKWVKKKGQKSAKITTHLGWLSTKLNAYFSKNIGKHVQIVYMYC